MSDEPTIAQLLARIESLEYRIAVLENERTGYIRRMGNDAIPRSENK